MKHPLHPALVHFPVACWSLATLADVAGLWWTRWPLWQLAFALLAIGCASGLLAAAAGVYELLKLPARHPAERDANVHMGLALLTWCLYAGSLLLRLPEMQPIPPETLALALSVAGFAALAVTGWLGGKLVYVHGVGRAQAKR